MKTRQLYYCVYFLWIFFATSQSQTNLNLNIMSQCRCTSEEQCLKYCKLRPDNNAIIKTIDEHDCSEWDSKKYWSSERAIRIICLPCKTEFDQELHLSITTIEKYVNLSEFVRWKNIDSNILEIKVRESKRDLLIFPECIVGNHQTVVTQIDFCGAPQKPDVRCRASPHSTGGTIPILRVVCDWVRKRTRSLPSCKHIYTTPGFVIEHHCKKNGNFLTLYEWSILSKMDKIEKWTKVSCIFVENIETCHVTLDTMYNVDLFHRMQCPEWKFGFDKFPNLSLNITATVSSPKEKLYQKHFLYHIDLNSVYFDDSKQIILCGTTYCNVTVFVPNFAEFCMHGAHFLINTLVYANETETKTVKLHKNLTFVEYVKPPCSEYGNITVVIDNLHAGYEYIINVTSKLEKSSLSVPHSFSKTTLPKEPNVTILSPPGAFYKIDEMLVVFAMTVSREHFSAQNFTYLLEIVNDYGNHFLKSSTPKFYFNISDYQSLHKSKLRFGCRNSVAYCSGTTDALLDINLKGPEDILVTSTSEMNKVEITYTRPIDNVINYTIFWCQVGSLEWFECNKNLQYAATVKNKYEITLSNSLNYVYAVSACYQHGCSPMIPFLPKHFASKSVHHSDTSISTIVNTSVLLIIFFVGTITGSFVVNRRINKHVREQLCDFEKLADEQSLHSKMLDYHLNVLHAAKNWFRNVFQKTWDNCGEELERKGYISLVIFRTLIIRRYDNNSVHANANFRELDAQDMTYTHRYLRSFINPTKIFSNIGLKK